MKHLIYGTALGMAVALASGPASAAFIFQTTLIGANEVPPNNSPATGSSTVTLADDNNTLGVQLSFSNLTSPATMAHIHCCVAPGGDAPIALPFPDFPSATSGTYTNTFSLSAPGVLTGITPAAFLSGLESGLAYINIHDANFPAGEIRGFLPAVSAAVPEPWGLALFGIGLAGLIAAGRRRTSSHAHQ
ncbi:MAG: CHRD domain-containing protein [Acetobacteraceae bacterium]|nr:CHRD domain-containing protein [Acetobacteraceae bacterium]MBV8520673.1 CHRD domain-containing protein [Acetobacteraceae bacterium]MBV8592244.1 CHRD domain-containing protein [Acetobacteraceae bacterium]